MDTASAIRCAAVRIWVEGRFRANTTALNQLLQHSRSGCDADACGVDVIFRTGGADLPAGGLGEALVQIVETAGDVAVEELAFDEGDGFLVMEDNEIDFAAIDIAEVAQLHVVALCVDLEFDPLEEMTSYEVFKARTGIGN
jgi:hypothetical protein